MKNVILAGFIAGLVSGIVSSIIVGVGASVGLYGTGIIIPVTYQANAAILMIVLTVIFGTIVSLIYSRFYDRIPGEGLKKGLFFGLMIWFIKDIMASAYVTLPMMQPTVIGISLISVGLYMWPIYGLVIGYLYKPTK